MEAVHRTAGDHIVSLGQCSTEGATKGELSAEALDQLFGVDGEDLDAVAAGLIGGGSWEEIAPGWTEGGLRHGLLTTDRLQKLVDEAGSPPVVLAALSQRVDVLTQRLEAAHIPNVGPAHVVEPRTGPAAVLKASVGARPVSEEAGRERCTGSVENKMIAPDDFEGPSAVREVVGRRLQAARPQIVDSGYSIGVDSGLVPQSQFESMNCC
eukprot:TRINITY_DN2942_c0_g1_i2.p1 TRINITY_DN2942_c0_g1~~TRINITY_DN2942_c0_g1_i2.p1  ORF type:complete len:210 (+),score=26.08 TRINITY_DN2942_c0_g1_i2:149-778(+)